MADLSPMPWPTCATDRELSDLRDDTFRRCSGEKASPKIGARVLFLNGYNLTMPDHVVDAFDFALHLAQMGKKHNRAKPLKGFGGASVLEVANV